jgi:7-cyano-7-deazaguanine synthase
MVGPKVTLKDKLMDVARDKVKKIEQPRKAFVLLSGGLDSTTCLHKAIMDFSSDNPSDTLRRIQGNAEHWNKHFVCFDPIGWVEAISINYGQRHSKEMEHAAKSCAIQGIKHTILELKDILGGAMLTDASIAVPNIDYADIKGVSPTYVPFRNGTLLSLITAHAQKWVNACVDVLTAIMTKQEATVFMQNSVGIYFGAHSEDAANWAYPDCTPEFIGAMANAIYIGSYQAIRLYTPLQWLMKADIVELGTRLGVSFENTWSCYKGEEKHCGVCPTCRSRRAAFNAVGIADPTAYAFTAEYNAADK